MDFSEGGFVRFDEVDPADASNFLFGVFDVQDVEEQAWLVGIVSLKKGRDFEKKMELSRQKSNFSLKYRMCRGERFFREKCPRKNVKNRQFFNFARVV